MVELRSNLENALRQVESERQRAEELIGLERSRAAEQLETAQRNAAEQLEAAQRNTAEQLALAKEAYDKQLEALKKMNREQVETQLKMLKEQMMATSEEVLRVRQAELGEANKEQVSKIVDPLQKSLKDMKEALDDSKEKHQEALHKLDATIQANIRNSVHLNDTAERLTRALTGEVKVQGNFGELKLRQLLEDLGLKEGEQFSSQEHLRDRLGNIVKDDDGRGLIPDFILHFPNNRDVIVDSKMSFTAYERYVNTEEPEEKTRYLKEHIVSVRAQVDRLYKKDYSKYLKEGYAKLNFVIMYIHTEGALNLALLNDGALWREAYDKGVLILGPQTMYMNLRILELMWTQVRQLQNQEEMIKQANLIVERTQDFATRFAAVEGKMRDTVRAMDQLKVTTSDGGPSLIRAAKQLVAIGARENKKKKSLDALESSMFIDSDTTLLLTDSAEEIPS
ncbi:MAG: DNA recombination protein RmuC [Bacteroidales bacterium]|nr:DNA recombination protein RmuC [Bacteroidales bacterium]